jgi:uncharacterized protein YwgA
MGTISADTFRRLYLVYLLAQFQRGSFGLKRLHKVAYIPEREDESLRPFEFRKYFYGQYSDSLDDIKDQLISMGFVAAVPLRPREAGPDQQGNRFFVTERANWPLYHRVLAAISPGLPRLMQRVVKEYGYKVEKELVDLCYQFPEFVAAKDGEVIFSSNLPERMEVNLSEDECEDLELALKPELVVPMVRLAEALDETDIDWDKVQEVERLPVPGS